MAPQLAGHRNTLLLAATLLGSLVCVASAQQARGDGDTSTIEIRGRITQYVLSPNGTVNGLILRSGAEYSLTTNGSLSGLALVSDAEVLLPPRAASEIAFVVRPGDEVTIRGARSGPGAAVTAASVTNDDTGAVVRTGAPQTLGDQSRIRQQLHNQQGELDGVLLEDGTIVRVSPRDATLHAASLVVGLPLYASGEGVSGPLGKVIDARRIGASHAVIIDVAAPAF